MGKRRQITSTSKASKPPKKHHSAAPTGIEKRAQPKKKHVQVSQTQLIIPFSKKEHILLIGEGDLSFARSLVEGHGCKRVVASVLEGSEAELVGKYPAAEENIRVIKEAGARVVCGVDVKKKGGVRVVGKERFERVFFNFPHVGGKSTDVNRQVRYNQGTSPISLPIAIKQKLICFGGIELLVSFFAATKPLLSPTPGSSILVTLFEGPPYTLWNIRDLARHSGLEVKRSWRFQREVWTGYRHARTLGVVKGGGGWKGEERDARMY
ncbi:25S rRNA (uridine-N(3))-methyltransferase, partial [Lachnellula suecica]